MNEKQTSYELISPEIAKRYLEHNISNYRPMNALRAEAYAKDMKCGRWQDNGESIKFNKAGILVDGQHRLQAIIIANTAVWINVIRNIENNVSIFDVAQGRTIVQIAKNSNLKVTDTNTLGAARILVEGFNLRGNASRGLVIEFAKKNEDMLRKSLTLTCVNEKHPISRKAPLILLTYCLLNVNADELKIKQFWSVVNTGFPIPNKESSPAIVLRNFIINDYKAFSYSLPNGDRAKYLFSIAYQAFNDFDKDFQRFKKYKPDYKKSDELFEKAKRRDD